MNSEEVPQQSNKALNLWKLIQDEPRPHETAKLAYE